MKRRSRKRVTAERSHASASPLGDSARLSSSSSVGTANSSSPLPAVAEFESPSRNLCLVLPREGSPRVFAGEDEEMERELSALSRTVEEVRGVIRRGKRWTFRRELVGKRLEVAPLKPVNVAEHTKTTKATRPHGDEAGNSENHLPAFPRRATSNRSSQSPPTARMPPLHPLTRLPRSAKLHPVR